MKPSRACEPGRLFHRSRNRPSLALALAISERDLAGQGATRVHGGGFAGTIQAFVPSALTEGYLRAMNEVFGTNAATKVGLRPYGGIALDLLG